ncbi:MAG: hypothetical protein HRU35_05860 [Rickettsiaceae bacterium]|nr:hypothetical protein [Rickettsiaceae bacterium]
MNETDHGTIFEDVQELINTVKKIKVENKDKDLKNFDLQGIDEFKKNFNEVYDDMLKHDDLKQKFGGKNSIKDWFNKKLDQIKDMCIGKLGVTLDSRTKDKLNLISDKLNKFKPPKGQSAHSTPPNPNKTQDQGHKL